MRLPGILHLVSTPIGNLDDITLRALRVLREATLVAAEDTRRTAGLLAHFDIATPLVSVHEHNEQARVADLVERLRRGDRVALVSDAGTPLLSDPGAALVHAALEAGVRVEPVPGPSALLAALVVSGLDTGSFTFLGFPPARAGERERWLRAAGSEPRTVVFYEAPHRIGDTLTDALRVLGDRQVVVARELTKLHEEHLRGSISEVLARLGKPRGEFTVVLAAADAEEPPTVDLDPTRARAEFDELTANGGLSRREAVAALARRYARPAREVYAAIERGKRGEK